jgi:hypothetical protein
MADFYDGIDARTKGAWVVHHGQKTATTVNGAAEFPAIDTAGKAGALLSQLAGTAETTVERTKVEALAKAAGLNPRLEVPGLLALLKERRVVDIATTGAVAVLGLTTSAAVQHAANVFEDQEPTAEERASIALAELTSKAPLPYGASKQFLSDEFHLSSKLVEDLLQRTETVGFVDAEGQNNDKLFFNGNLFRRDNLTKVSRVLGSLSSTDLSKVNEIDEKLSQQGCLSVEDIERTLGIPLFEKLRAAGMYDVNHVANASGEFGFVTKPAAFHKFNDPLVDDAFDLAKTLVAALFYGMTQSSAGRGRIGMITALLRRLISGQAVGPATAIGEDYRVLETRGVLKVTPGPRFGFLMKLMKIDIGEMALSVLTTGEAASTNVLERPFSGMSGYQGPEQTRSDFRRKRQVPASKKSTQDVLEALRTGGF